MSKVTIMVKKTPEPCISTKKELVYQHMFARLDIFVDKILFYVMN